MFSKIREFFWPILEAPSAEEVEEDKQSEAQLVDAIQNIEWSVRSEIALDEARRLLSEEDERRKTAESKASNLLLVAAALIPLLTYLEAAIWDGKLGIVPMWLTLPVLAFAVIYLGNAAIWAFRTVKVGSYSCVYPIDLVQIWSSGKEIENELIAEMLIATRRNQDAVNMKVTATVMTHEFLLRAVWGFSLLILIRIFFGFWSAIKQPILDFYHYYLACFLS